jgi:hypothetical protein
MGGGWEVEGGQVDGWDMDAASASSVITVGTPLYKTRQSGHRCIGRAAQKQQSCVTRDSRAIPQPSITLAQPCLSLMF